MVQKLILTVVSWREEAMEFSYWFLCLLLVCLFVFYIVPEVYTVVRLRAVFKTV
jgi:hypothetical protein